MKTKTGFKWSKVLSTTVRFFPLITVLAIPVTFAMAEGLITKTELYNDVWWGTFTTWLIISLIGSVLTGFITAMYNVGCGAIVFVGGILILGLGGGNMNSSSQANAAVSSDWDAMVIEKATYVEKLLGVWVRADRIRIPQDGSCHNADTDFDIGAEAATGCRNVTKDSYCASRDDDGDCTDTDYKWYPWFEYEESLTGDLNIYQSGHVVFAEYCAPKDWQSHLLTNGFIFEQNNLPAGASFCVADSPEWDRVNSAVNNNTLLPGVVYHNTLNWVNADPETVYRGSTRLVPEYQKAGIMPTILSITDSQGNAFDKDQFGNTKGPLGYDFKIVQFLGSLNPPTEFQATMQKQALLWASVAGPKLKSNLMLNFAYAREIPDRYQWISTTKAHLMDNSEFGKKSLAMNMAIWNCGVSDDNTQVLWCVMETGAFEDNVELKVFVSQLQPFPFTSGALFGLMSGGLILDGGKPIMENPDWDDRNIELAKTDISFSGGVVNEAMYGISSGHVFVKVSKDRYADKLYMIRPDESQIQRIKDNKSGSTWFSVLGLWGVIVLFAAGAISKILHT